MKPKNLSALTFLFFLQSSCMDLVPTENLHQRPTIYSINCRPNDFTSITGKPQQKRIIEHPSKEPNLTVETFHNKKAYNNPLYSALRKQKAYIINSLHSAYCTIADPITDILFNSKPEHKTVNRLGARYIIYPLFIKATLTLAGCMAAYYYLIK